MHLAIARTYLPTATVGSLTVDGAGDFHTIEPPKTGPLTCVPEGLYTLEPYQSPTHGPTWCLRNNALGIMGADPLTEDQVEAGLHNLVELHSGNWVQDSRKCVLVGLGDSPMFDPHTGAVEPAIERSVAAMGQLLGILGPLTSGHTLAIGS